MYRPTHLLILLLTGFAFFTRCTKKQNSTAPTAIQFSVNGVTDVTLRNFTNQGTKLSITATSTDTALQKVSLSLSGLPPGIVIDTTYTRSGYPVFTSTITFFDSTVSGITPGTYPVTLTASGSSGSIKNYEFNIIVLDGTLCSSKVVGAYYGCFSYSVPGKPTYNDHIAQDSTILNKIWFENYANSGKRVYGYFKCSSDSIVIPYQVVDGKSYRGGGTVTDPDNYDIVVGVTNTQYTIHMGRYW